MGRPASKAFLAALKRSPNAGRSTTGAPAVPYYVESPIREAVKHLRLVASRFLAMRATAGDLDEAILIFNATSEAAPTAIVPRKEWDASAADMGNSEETADYVDGWNEAIAAYEAALLKRQR